MGCRVATLGELCSGGGRYGLAASAVEFDENLPTYLRITDINDDGTLNPIDRKSVASPSSNDYMLHEGDIVFARTGNSTGRNYYYDSRDGDFAFAGFLIKFSLDNSKVNPRYIKYYTQSKAYWDWVASFSTGSTRGNINAKTYAQMPVMLPERSVQDAIVVFCDAISDKLRVNTLLNGYLEELLLSLFSALSPNDKWTEGRADSYYEIGIGKTPPRKEPEWFSAIKDDNHVWLSIKDMREPDVYSLDSSEYLTDEAVKAKNVRQVKAGSILLSFKLTVGRVKIAGCDMTTNEAIACFASKDKRKLAYAYPFLRSFDYGKLGSTSSIATAVNSKTIKAMPFFMPSDSELDAFYDSTKSIYEQLLNNARESRSLVELRDALLPILMSGEIDVSKIDLTQLNSHLV